jgi:amino acid adenylation domain-containing protein
MRRAQVPRGRPRWHPPGSYPAGFEPFPVAAVERSIGARLTDLADRHADRPALAGPGGRQTYAELLAGVQRHGAALRERVGDDPVPIGVLAGHDVGLVEAVLAVVGAGHTVLVLDPVAPEGLNRALLDDAGAPLVLVDAEHAEAGRALAGDAVVRLEALDGPAAPLPAVDPGTPAMLAYTSGTSGLPKAAVVSHRQLLHLVRGATEALAIRPDDRLPMLFPLSLAVAAYPALLAVLSGASLHTFDVRGAGFADLPAWLADQGITVAYLAPTVVRFLDGAVGDRSFPELRLVALGGERVDRGAVDLVHRLFGAEVDVVNGYGTTETGVLTFWFVGTAADAEAAGPGDGAGIPAGFPIPGMDLAVVDDEGTVLPAGRTGELTVAGRYLFSGYRGHPELDAAVLERDEATGRSVYRTGDLARLGEDGALELVGRVDTQVKVRGRRVVLAEVEELLLGSELVEDAAVVAGRDGAGHTVVVAHVVPRDGDLDVSTLRAELARTAPAPMVPSTLVLHDALPQLPNGKLDRQALARSDVEDRPQLSSDYRAPEDGLEADLVALWEELLGVHPVGVDDDFFDLGGDSLLAGRMLVELEAGLGHRVPMAALLDARTVATLAASVPAYDGGERPASGLVSIQEGDADRPTLYVTHDLLGSVFRYGSLAEALGPDQTVRGFESPALTGERFPFTRIETLALRYVTELQKDQPEGPYHLLGYSFGGILAFEMARQLRRAGEEVALLAVVDIGPGYQGIDEGRIRPPRGPWLDLPDPAPRGTGLGGRARRATEVARTRPGALPRYLLYNSRLRHRVLPVAWRWQLRDGGRIPPQYRLWYAHQTHWKLVGPSWRGAPYDGEIVLFWSEATGSADATMGWAPLGATVEIHRIAADHERILDRDQVQHLAAPLREVLDGLAANRTAGRDPGTVG